MFGLDFINIWFGFKKYLSWILKIFGSDFINIWFGLKKYFVLILIIFETYSNQISILLIILNKYVFSFAQLVRYL